MPRVKGSGVIKQIDAAKHDAVTIREMLHSGGQPAEDKLTRLFLKWHNLIRQSDDCEVRSKRGEGTKWTRKRIKGLRKEIAETWQQIGAVFSVMHDAELTEALLAFSKVTQPPVYGWRAETTRQIEIAYLLRRDADGRQRSKLPQLGGARVNITAKQLHNWLTSLRYNVTIHDVRRFVRNTLRVTLRGERGRRHDLEQ